MLPGKKSPLITCGSEKVLIMGIIHCNVLRKERSPSFTTEPGLGMIISKIWTRHHTSQSHCCHSLTLAGSRCRMTWYIEDIKTSEISWYICWVFLHFLYWVLCSPYTNLLKNLKITQLLQTASKRFPRNDVVHW